MAERRARNQGMATAAGRKAGDARPTSEASRTGEKASVGPTFRVVEMTVPWAKDLLDRRRPDSRDSPAAVAAYADAMKRSRWILNGMPIIVADDGSLLDGVQRLKACVLSGRPFTTVLAEGIPPDVLHTVDQHRRRSFVQVLALRNIAHPFAVQAALIKLIRLSQGHLPERRGPISISWSLMDRVLRANPEVAAGVAESVPHPAKLLPEPARSPIIIMGRMVAPAALDRLLAALANPDDFPVGEPGAQLARRMEETLYDPNTRPSVTTTIALAIKALNATISGEKIRLLRWVPTEVNRRIGEPFPALLGWTGLREVDADAPDEAPPLADAKRDGIEITVETIGPRRAAGYLKQNQGNRRISPGHVDAIGRDITEGRWMLNAQPICFAASGRLLNGQHRLSAVVKSGVAIEVVVVRGLSEEAFTTYDQGLKKATLSEVGDKRIGSFGDRTLLTAVASLIWKNERRPPNWKAAKPSAAEVKDIVDQNPDLLDLRTHGRRMTPYMIPSAAIYCAYVVTREHKRLAEVWLERLETGAELPAGHPITKLRRKLADLRKAGSSRQEQMEAYFTAWDAFRREPRIAGVEGAKRVHRHPRLVAEEA